MNKRERNAVSKALKLLNTLCDFDEGINHNPAIGKIMGLLIEALRTEEK